MSDNETQNQDSPKIEAQEQGMHNGPITILAQYVKDLSFENPHAPDTLRPGQEAPEMDINVGLSMKQMQGAEVFEVMMHVEARAMRNVDNAQQVVFVVELDYAVLVDAANVPERQRHPILMIEVPKLGFPFARQILSDLTAQGGYPPVLLNPVDFEGLYIQQYQEQQTSETAASSNA